MLDPHLIQEYNSVNEPDGRSSVFQGLYGTDGQVIQRDGDLLVYGGLRDAIVSMPQLAVFALESDEEQLECTWSTRCCDHEAHSAGKFGFSS